MSLQEAADRGDEEAVGALLAAGAPAKAANRYPPIHIAASRGNVCVMQVLAEAGPATVRAAAGGSGKTPLRCTFTDGHTAVLLVMEATPDAIASCVEDFKKGAKQHLLRSEHHAGVTIMEAARLLVRAAAVQPTLGSLLKGCLRTGTLYANLVGHVALTKKQWQLIPAHCPDMVRVLPAVLDRSVAEAGWLVGRLGQRQRAQLRTAALCLNRAVAEVEGAPSLPTELTYHILALALEQILTPEECAASAKEWRAAESCKRIKHGLWILGLIALVLLLAAAVIFHVACFRRILATL